VIYSRGQYRKSEDYKRSEHKSAADQASLAPPLSAGKLMSVNVFQASYNGLN
jgi:hypothetical protein